MQAYKKKVQELFQYFNVDQSKGLSYEQVLQQRQKYGRNKLVEKKQDSWLLVFIKQFQSPLIYILLFAAVVIYFVGNDSLDAFIISGILFFNAIIGTFQEGRARNILATLRRFIKSDCVVLRDGKKELVIDLDLVPGDIIFLQGGGRVPADCRIIISHNLMVDEAVLTGESIAKEKQVAALQDDVPVADRSTMVYRGTYILSGSATVLVVATGKYTEIGKIAKQTEEIDTRMPLKKEIDRLSHWILIFIFAMCAVLFIVGLLHGKPIRELFVMLTALFICVIPEGLPFVLTIVLISGVYQMAKRNVLVKRMQAVDALGRANVLLIDKTGTLTRNELMVNRVVTSEKTYIVSGVGYYDQGDITTNGTTISLGDEPVIDAMATACALLNRSELSFVSKSKLFTIKGDPTEAAMNVFAQKLDVFQEKLQRNYKLLFEIPFDSASKYHAVFYEHKNKGAIFLSGVPELLLKKCENISDYVKDNLHVMLEQGLRVVAVARKEFEIPKQSFDSKEQEKKFFISLIKKELEFVGLCGIQDAIRPEVKAVVEQAQKAGISIVMMTGDHKKTALYVAKKVGIFQEKNIVFEGSDLETMSDEELFDKLKYITVFARVSPSQKLRLVQLFQRQKNIVAMTGDGVNDGPALIAADLGIAMGHIGTEVAKQASDIVLLDDSFSNIVSGIAYGRHIFYTLRRVILYFFATNMGEVLVVLFALFLNLPLPITAAQILWLNLITDGFLDSALAMEQQEENLLQTKSLHDFRIVDWSLIAKMMYLSLPMGIFSLLVFYYTYQVNLFHARTLTLVTMAMFQWFNAFNCRSETKSVFSSGFFSNKWLLLAVFFVFVLQIMVLHVPFFQYIFKTEPISLFEWIVICCISSSVLFMEELRKHLVSRFNR